MQRHRQITCLFYQLQRTINSIICRIAFRRCGKIHTSLSKGNASLRPSYLHHCIKSSIGKQQSIRIGKSYILRRTDNQSARNELRIFPSLYHTCHPIECRIRITATYTLYECRYNIIVHLSLLIIRQRILLQPALHKSIIYHNRLR